MSLDYYGEAVSPHGRVAPDYIIRKSGSYYLAEPRFNLHALADTSLSQLWQDINSEVGEGPVVEFGTGQSFVLDDTIEIEYDATVIYGQGPQNTQITLDDNVDDDMIRNKNGDYFFNTYIGNLALDGNDANNSAGRGIEMIVGAATASQPPNYWHWLSFWDLIITDCDDEGLVVQTTGGAHATVNLVRFRINDCGQGTFGYPVAFDRIFDSWIGGMRSSCNSLLLDSVTTTNFSNIYFMGSRDEQVLLKGGSIAFPDIGGNVFTGCRFDNPNGSALKIDEYQKRNLFNGCMFTNFSQSGTTNTHPAVEVTDADALYNMWMGCFFGHINVKTDDRWKYAFQETQDTYSILQNCVTGYGAIDAGNAEHFATDEADLVGGSHSTINDCIKGDGNAWGVV